MLVLSRKLGEEVVIGDGIRVTVLEMRGDRVKLGFVAPGEVPIHRKEIHRAIQGSLLVMGHTGCI
ncbi:MAG: carbon storage regulator CsrA [Planctomycetota bacterium]